ncbi:MAG: DNA starvation/stationary phase protection protein [Acidobacteria bacterium]|nr:DNA starvation/stationary phase protection protein [Acidobacteriota bacterium]
MAPRILDSDVILQHAAPLGNREPHEIQPYGHLIKSPIALPESVCRQSVENLNQLLADTMTLASLYKKHHWQVTGPTFYPLHLLFDKHHEAQDALIDVIAERIQLLGGISVAMAPDVAELTIIPRPPKGREPVSTQISRLLHAHEVILREARAMAHMAGEQGDDGTNDLIVSSIVRTNEMQVYFVSQHVVDVPLVEHETHQHAQK